MGFDTYLQLFDKRMYEDCILPAYRAFLDRRDVRSLVSLLREAERRLASMDRGESDAGPYLLTREDCSEAIDILEGRVVYDPSRAGRRSGRSVNTRPEDLELFVREHVAPGLVEVLCLEAEAGVVPVQNLGRSALVPHLFGHSSWLKEALTFERIVTCGALEIAIGQSSEWVATENVERFRAELESIPRPQGNAELEEQFDNLHEILRRALCDVRLAIVLTVG